MAVYPITKLEPHPVGTSGPNGIIDGNWEILEAIFNPATSDAAYRDIIVNAMIRGTIPSVSGTVLEYVPGVGMIARQGLAVNAPVANVATIDFKGATMQTVAIAAATTFASSNLAAGRKVSVAITADATLRALTFPAGWVFLGAAAPASLAASKTALLELWSNGTADAGVLARYTAAP